MTFDSIQWLIIIFLVIWTIHGDLKKIREAIILHASATYAATVKGKNIDKKEFDQQVADLINKIDNSKKL